MMIDQNNNHLSALQDIVNKSCICTKLCMNFLISLLVMCI